jgi:hemin uptake protein HemP
MATKAAPLPSFMKMEKSIAVNDNHEYHGALPATPCEKEDPQCKLCKQIKEMRVITAEELLQGHREMIILHAGQVYRLMRTRNDKLILQK